MIIVSHDRDFLDGLVHKIYEFKNRNVKDHPGDIFEFLRKKRLDSLQELERRQQVKVRIEKPESSEKKVKYEEKRELERQRRKISCQLWKLWKKYRRR